MICFRQQAWDDYQFWQGTKTGDLVHPGNIALAAFDRLDDMAEKILETQVVEIAHSGCASSRTRWRNFSGRAFGVRTSIGMPSSSLSS